MRIFAIACLIGLGGLLVACALLYAPDKPRSELEARYAGPPSTFVTVEGLRLHVRDTGPRDGPAVVMLHGFGASLHMWEPWAEALSDRFRVVRLDLPGFGLTGPDPTGDYSDARTLRILAALMDSLAIPRATILGHSMGGRFAWMFAAAQPRRVDKLVLLAPDGFASKGFAYGKRVEIPALMRVLPYTMPRFMVRKNLEPAFADPAALSEETLTRYRDMLLAPGVRGAILERTAQVELQPPEPFLTRIEAPVLLLWGEKDAMIPIANAQDYLANLRDARLVALPGLGHLPQEEAPARALVPLRAFLER